MVRLRNRDPWRLPAWVLAAAVLIPLISVFSSFLTPEKEIWQHLSTTLLPDLA